MVKVVKAALGWAASLVGVDVQSVSKDLAPLLRTRRGKREFFLSV